MPATVRRTSRTGLPGPRSEISFRWTSKAIKQLLKLIQDRPDCRVTFFPTGLIQHYTKSGLARGLLLEMVKKEPEYLAWLKSEGMIKKDGEGKWIPRDTWTSTSITNPVITQMASLKRKFDAARKENTPPPPPTIPRGEQGQSRQAPIEIDSDSSSSFVVKIIDHPISKARKYTRKAEPTIPADSRLKFRHGSEADKVDLKRLKRRLGMATRLHSEDGTTEPKIFRYIPTERDRYLKADADGRDQIIKRARTHLLFRVLRDLERFLLPQCLADCGLYIDPVLQKNYWARTDQIRRIIKSAGGKVLCSEKRLGDTKRAVRIYLFDDGPETKGITKPMDAGDADQDVEHRVYNILEFSRFLRRHIFHHKI